MATPIKFYAEVSSVVRHGADVATYEFRYLGRRPRYKAGQFLHLALDLHDPAGFWPESRVFTIAKGATDSQFIRLTIAAKGKFTHRILQELQVGSKVSMKAPYGDFIVHTRPAEATVLVAGGTGVTPFVAFMEDALVQGIAGPAWLHYGARRPDLLVFKTLADRCAAQFSNFCVRYYAEEDAAEGIVPGRIDLDCAVRCLPDGAMPRFYLCGPQPMIDAFSARLTTEFALPRESVCMDQWE
jgi:ferredoxin-NADP reductase